MAHPEAAVSPFISMINPPVGMVFNPVFCWRLLNGEKPVFSEE